MFQLRENVNEKCLNGMIKASPIHSPNCIWLQEPAAYLEFSIQLCVEFYILYLSDSYKKKNNN